MTYIGIDIAAASFDMVVRKSGRSLKATNHKQSAQSHLSVAKQLVKLNPERIIIEATGIYYLDLAVALYKAGLPVCVINPKSFHHFAALKLQSTKTDRIDAALLAEYGERISPKLWEAPNETFMELRAIGRHINRLTHQKTQAKNRLHALKATQTTASMLIDDEQEGIEYLEIRIKRLTRAAKELINKESELALHFTNIQCAKGISEASCISILGEVMVLPRELKAPQVVRHAGMDVRLTQSGTSIDKPGRLSKTGNSYLRSALFMPALNAANNDQYARAFKDTLMEKPKKKKIQAICAIMRKYLMGIWACIKTGQPFDASLLFSEAHLKG